MKKNLLLAILILLAPRAGAQLKTYLTVETGPQWSLVSVSDPGGIFQGASAMSAIAGASLSQEILPDLSLAAGLYYQPYRDGINMIDDRPQQPGWAAFDALLIPVRVEYRLQFPDLPVSFTPRLGYVFGIPNLPEAPYSASGIISAPDGTAYNYSLSHAYASDKLHMLEVGLGVNLRILGLWQASVNLSYLNGFTEPFTTTLDYATQGSSPGQAVYSGKGNSLSATLAFGIPVSNLWQNRDYRIRARIENSVYAGKPVSRKGHFYTGAELGSLWRLFNTTNPATGARPMSERGLFRYANLQAGAYFGYMMTDELGIDVGANFQGSTTFFAIMVDHEVDFVTKLPAPMFLEVPVRIRYFYNLYKEKLHYVVYGGASLLTHFTSGTYNVGGGVFSYHTPGGGTPEATTSFYASRASRLRPLLRIGTGVEYRLPVDFKLIATLYVNYMHGFASAEDIFVTSGVPETPSETRVGYNGSGWSVDLGVRIPLRFGIRGICEDLPEREK